MALGLVTTRCVPVGGGYLKLLFDTPVGTVHPETKMFPSTLLPDIFWVTPCTHNPGIVPVDNCLLTRIFTSSRVVAVPIPLLEYCCCQPG